jgi:hypothetical protein
MRHDEETMVFSEKPGFLSLTKTKVLFLHFTHDKKFPFFS